MVVNESLPFAAVLRSQVRPHRVWESVTLSLCVETNTNTQKYEK